MKVEFSNFIWQMNSLNWSQISRKIFNELAIDEQRMPLADFAERVTHCSLDISIVLLREYHNWLMRQLCVENEQNEV